jgi:hypothetical protein
MTTAITEFSKRVQPDVMGCPKQIVDAAVVDTIIKFCEETHVMERAFEHDVAAVDIQTADNNSVNVNMETYFAVAPATMTIRPIIVTEFKIDGSPMNVHQIYLANVVDDISEHTIQGAKLFTYPDRTHIKLYDITAEAQRFYIKQAFAPLTTITTVTDEFFDRYRKAIEAGARAELMSMPKKDWTNPERAHYFRGVYTDSLVISKTRKEQGFAIGSTRPRSMRFF